MRTAFCEGIDTTLCSSVLSSIRDGLFSALSLSLLLLTLSYYNLGLNPFLHKYLTSNSTPCAFMLNALYTPHSLLTPFVYDELFLAT